MELNQKHLKFIEGLVAGKTQIKAYLDAGYECNMESAAVDASRLLSNAKIKEEYHRRLDEIQERAWEALKRKTEDAAVKLGQMMDYSTQYDSVKLRAAQDILDRCGIKQTEKLNIEGKLDITIVSEYVNERDTDQEE